MRFGQAFKMAFKSILGNKVRTVLTMLGIIIGVAAVITLISLVQGYRTSLMEWVEKQGTNKISVSAATWSQTDLTDDLYDYCLKLDKLVLGTTPNAQYYGGIKYQEKTVPDSTVFYGSDQYSLCNNYTVAEGRDLSFLDIEKYHKVCVIGSYIKEQLFGFTDPIGKSVIVDGESLTVVGVFAEKYGSQQYSGDQMIVVPYTISRYIGDYVYNSEFTVKAKDAKSTTEAITRIQGFLSTRINESNGYYNVSTTNTQIEDSNELTRMLSLVLGGIAGIALLVGGIGIMNIMLVTVSERTREIGIRRAIGAERSAIVTQFLIEASMISTSGGIVGIILGFLLTLILGKIIFDLVLLPSLIISFGAMAFSVLLGVGFGMYPAIRASGLQPVDALRAE